MALKRFREAARTAIIIANEEQNAGEWSVLMFVNTVASRVLVFPGNYRTAHDVLFSMFMELKKNKIKIPAEMSKNLMILHSYILVKVGNDNFSLSIILPRSVTSRLRLNRFTLDWKTIRKARACWYVLPTTSASSHLVRTKHVHSFLLRTSFKLIGSCRCGQPADVNRYRVSSFGFGQLVLQLLSDAHATWVPWQDRPEVQEKHRRIRQVRHCHNLTALTNVCGIFHPLPFRRPNKTEEDEPVSPCPYCEFNVAETELVCPECKNELPYCVVTVRFCRVVFEMCDVIICDVSIVFQGRHIVKDDLTVCPQCKFPALLSEFLK